MVSFVTVTIIDNQPDTKLIAGKKWAGMKYKQVLRYYQEKDEKEADMPYLYIPGCDETQKTLKILPI